MKKLAIVVASVLLTATVAFAGSIACPSNFTIPESATLEQVVCTVSGFQVASPVVVDIFDTPNGNLSDVVVVSNTTPTSILVSFISDSSNPLIEPPPTMTETENPTASFFIKATSVTPGGPPLIMQFSSDGDPAGAISDGASFLVPEPAGLALLGSGLLLMGGVLRRKLRKQV